MVLVKTDSKGRIVVPKPLRKALHIEPEEVLELVPKGRAFVVRHAVPLHKSRKQDYLGWLHAHPAKVSREKIRKISLEKLEEEAWTP